MLENKNVLLCVTGGIAAYKAAALTSKLIQKKANVKVLMTESAQQFVTPLTFQSLARDRVYVDTFREEDPSVISHIDVADWADVAIVAPATANVIGKLANGIADDMVTTTLLATRAEAFIAPAMNVHMYEHPAVKRNMDTLQQDGYRFIEPGEGFLACGYEGKGRMSEPEEIVEHLSNHFLCVENPVWQNKKVLITAGPTHEHADPVRVLTNPSTGKMGYAIAREAARRGAQVTLVSGPTQLPDPSGVNVIRVTSANDMYEQVLKHYESSNVVIKAAAVSDFRPKNVQEQKVKKEQGSETIQLERTSDILAELGKQKNGQFLVGFAAESTDVLAYAREKLQRKNLDLIVANDVSKSNRGFAADMNEVTLIGPKQFEKNISLAHKEKVAESLLDQVAHLQWGGVK
ncbi:bifunctional phosphopantothenoylcysteine decarboxylase/phosphopantothenate--cysteine ligase CoaBC [Texcoconibacillus texcoconensis]|uniref:Coenzyme A biosynthesis bifunctional protein CoaBC n=1 Tax=Texcoconibacillus texcoconensis TaxID=1095777 RepID=A0A840QL91_9BACI|nr:bifunctional phosphopantothenoylcysteine decarboxylase/phosphopantothenate--cysteine ligase CoaBC [Texcoconibacillus texcoconensis]MBB5172133.1 phosphopantothenoylcysteine decarboxylase/phosphopantothenate--cysteine ligase [Texcoconibacillus texcoconensis]